MGLAEFLTPQLRAQLTQMAVAQGSRFASSAVRAMWAAPEPPAAEAQHAPEPQPRLSGYKAMADPVAGAVLNLHRAIRLREEHVRHREGCNCDRLIAVNERDAQQKVLRAITLGTTAGTLRDPEGAAILDELEAVANEHELSTQSRVRALSRLADRIATMAEQSELAAAEE